MFQSSSFSYSFSSFYIFYFSPTPSLLFFCFLFIRFIVHIYFSQFAFSFPSLSSICSVSAFVTTAILLYFLVFRYILLPSPPLPGSPLLPPGLRALPVAFHSSSPSISEANSECMCRVSLYHKKKKACNVSCSHTLPLTSSFSSSSSSFFICNSSSSFSSYFFFLFFLF